MSIGRLLKWTLLALLWSLLFAAAQLRGGATEWFAIVVLTGMICCAAAAPLISLRKPRVIRSLQEGEIEAGGELKVKLSFERAWTLPLVWVAVQERAVNPTDLAASPILYRRILLPWLNQSFAVDYTLRHLRRGQISFLPLELTIGDLFGLTQRKISMPLETTANVLPAVPKMEQRKEWQWASSNRKHDDIMGAGATAEIDIGRRSAMTSGKGQEVQPYAAGDPMRSIDWRSAAKGRGFMTRKAAFTAPLEKLIAVDCAASVYAGSASLFDTCISYAAWAYEDAVAAGWQARLYCSGQQPLQLKQSMRHSKQDEGLLARRQLAYVRADGSMPLAEQLAQRRLQDWPLHGTVLCISSGLQDWSTAAKQAALRDCRIELWLVMEQAAPSHALRAAIREWGQAGIAVKLWTKPDGSLKLPEAWEGDNTDVS